MLDRKAKKNQPTPVSGEAPRIVCSSFNKGVTVLEASNTENCNPQLSWLRRLFRQPLRKDGLAGSTAPPPGEKNNQPKKKKWSSRLFNCCSKNQPTPVSGEAPRIVCSSFNKGVTVLEASNTENCNPQLSWLRRLFRRPLRKDGLAGSTAPPPGEKNNQPKKKKWSSRLFNCCSRKNRVTPLSDHEDEQKPLQKLQRSLVKEKSHQAGDSVLVLEDFREDEEEKPRQQEKKLTVPFAQQTVIASSAKEKANVEDNLVKEKSHQAGDSVLVSEDEEEKPRQQEKKLTVPFAQQTVIASSAKEKANVEDNLVKEKSHQAGDSVLVSEDEEEKPRQQEKKLTVPFAQQTVIASSAKEKANVEDNLVKEKSHQAGDSVLVSEDEEEKPRQQEKKLTVPFAQQTVIASSAKEKANVEDNTDKVSQRRLSQWEQRLTCWQINLGFPNPAQNCYMNSSLQSLLTLTQFVRDIRSQEEVWSVFPEAQLMSYFMDIACLRDFGDRRRKLEALCELKRIISVKAPEFVDNHQKDAHEFLIAVLGQMRDLAAPLGQVASILGRTYSCPVERNLVFKMQNTRKCKRCGSPSVREEEFLNLSLDLIPGGSVQQMLEEYEKETDLEFSCKCGGKTSAQCSTFTTLPNFLVLQLKRFNFTETYELVKCHDPVDLTRELIVTSSQAKSWYSLVSVISHLGSEGNAGHYISSGLHPDMDPETTGDLWLNYNDSEVTCMTRENVCQSLEESAYLLFYQKMV